MILFYLACVVSAVPVNFHYFFKPQTNTLIFICKIYIRRSDNISSSFLDRSTSLIHLITPWSNIVWYLFDKNILEVYLHCFLHELFLTYIDNVAHCKGLQEVFMRCHLIILFVHAMTLEYWRAYVFMHCYYIYVYIYKYIYIIRLDIDIMI